MTATPPVASQVSSANLSATSAVVVNWNTGNYLLRCVAALASPHIVVVDNASSDRSAEAVAGRYPWVRLIANRHNVGYAAAVNQGVAHAPKTPYVLVTNADVICGPMAITAMAQWLDAHPSAALVGPCLRNNDSALQLSWGQEPHFLTECIQRTWWRRLEACGHLERYAATPKLVDWVLGACFMIRREAFDAVDGMDTRYFMYFEEVDLCTRLRRAGWEVWYLPEPIAAAVHFGRASTGQVPEAMAVAYRRSQIRYYRRFHGSWAAAILWGYLGVTLAWTPRGRRVLKELSG